MTAFLSDHLMADNLGRRVCAFAGTASWTTLLSF
jgi:hypothetical protein